ncbi:MAG: tyrosine-type recombinase/integrase, partial [Gammaproteobacteria bacterium]
MSVVPAVPLTEITIRNLTAKAGQRLEVWDGKLRGFGIRVSPNGTKTFVLMYYLHGRKRRESLGRFPHLSLADARAKAMGILGQVRNGIDPHAAEPSKTTVRFAAVVDEFVEKHCHVHNRKSTAYETARILHARFCSLWGSRDIRTIGRADIAAALDAAIKSKTPSAANHALAAVRKLFSWCVERGIVETNPCIGVSRPAPVKHRERALSDEELAAVWHAADAAGYPLGQIVKLLILTGQRRGEVAGMRWNEIDTAQALWTIPAERTKGRRRHVLPLSSLALAVIAEVPRLNDDLVFPARGSHTAPVSGFSKLAPKLAREISVADWTLHDI